MDEEPIEAPRIEVSPPDDGILSTSGMIRVRSKLCSVQGCNSTSLRNPELLFINVPSYNYPERRFVWLTLMRASRDTQRSYCCSRHFKVPDDFKDFEEFINTPPENKRPLTLKKNVVPHLNMPMINISAMPPITDKPQQWPESLRELYKSQVRRNTTEHTYAQVRDRSSLPVQTKATRAIQTESLHLGPHYGARKVMPSLLYCRLCFGRQDLEPIFTGDQTLIEPDIIDKIFGCTEVLVTVEADFPSSICSQCCVKLDDFVNFRKMVQNNDQSLRAPTLPRDFAGAPGITSFARTKITGSPIVRASPSTNPTRQTATISRTPSAEKQSKQPAALPSSHILFRQSVQPDDPLLEIGHVEEEATYERRQLMMEKNHPRAKRVQDSLFPLPYRRIACIDEPRRNVASSSPCKGPWRYSKESNQVSIEPVDGNDGSVVPVTLIRVQPEDSPTQADVEIPRELTENFRLRNRTLSSESDVILLREDTESSSGTLSANGSSENLNSTATGSNRSVNDVLEAVRLVRASESQTPTQQPNIEEFTGPSIDLTDDNDTPRIFNSVQPGRNKVLIKRSSIPGLSMMSKSIRGIKFPGTLTTLFSKKADNIVIKPQPSNTTIIKKTSIVNQQRPVTIGQSVVFKPTSIFKNVPAVLKVAPHVLKVAPHVVKESPHHAIKTTPHNLKDVSVPRPLELAQKQPCISSITTETVQKENISNPLPTANAPKKLFVRVTKLNLEKLAKEGVHYPPKKTFTQQKTVTFSKGNIPSISKPINEPSIKPLAISSKTSTVKKLDSTPSKTTLTKKLFNPFAAKVTPKLSTTTVLGTKKSNINTSLSSPSTTVRKQIVEDTVSVKNSPDEKMEDSPRSARVRKVPLKFQDTVGFPKPKTSPIKLESNNASNKLNKTEENVTVEKKLRTYGIKSGSNTPKESQQNPYAANEVKQKSPLPSKDLSLPDSTKPLKRKSNPDHDKDADPSPKPKAVKTQKLQPKTSNVDVSKVQEKQQQSKPKPNGSRKSAPAKMPAAPQDTNVAQDWKCPFCSEKIFTDKKGLVKHLRKRHGMDYALVRQRLAIYGGNWR